MVTLQAPMAARISGGRQAELCNSNSLMAKKLCFNAMFLNGRISGVLRRRSSKCGGVRVRVHNYPRFECDRRVRCRFSSSIDGDRAMDNSEGGDGDFVNCSVFEADEVRNVPEGFFVIMRDGRYLRCVYNHPKGYGPDYMSHPAIVLKLEDGSNLLLPIIVLEMPSACLMDALLNVEMPRPTVYHIVMEMLETMGFMVKYVRVTKRVEDAYVAELCVIRKDDETVSLNFDLRPSDAINIAVRCKAPIQVSRSLAHSDGLKIGELSNPRFRLPKLPDGSLLSEKDRPDGKPCPESEEFVILRNMLIAAVEERYHDATQWKDLLEQYRSKRQKQT